MLGTLSGIVYAGLEAQSFADFAVGSVLFGLLGFVYALMVALPLGAFWDKFAGLFSRRVRAFSKYQRAKRDYDSWLVRTTAEFWRSLPGLRFEQELAFLYTRSGCEVELTPPRGDKGADLILHREGKTTIVQCNATRRPVGPSVVRELYGTMLDLGDDSAILASVGGCTRGVYDFIVGKPISVIGLEELVRMQVEHESQPHDQATT